MILVLGIEIVRVTVFVSDLAIFFANATTLTLDWNFVIFEFLLFEYQISPTSYYDFQ